MLSQCTSLFVHAKIKEISNYFVRLSDVMMTMKVFYLDCGNHLGHMPTSNGLHYESRLSHRPVWLSNCIHTVRATVPSDCHDFLKHCHEKWTSYMHVNHKLSISIS